MKNIANKIINKNARLIMEIKKDIEIIPYQIEMLERNKIKGLLPFQYYIRFSKLNFAYLRKGKKSLDKWFKENNLNPSQAVIIIENILEFMNDNKKFLLFEANYCFDIENIYVDNKSQMIELIYFPIKPNSKPLEQFGEKALNILAATLDTEMLDKAKQILKVKDCTIENWQIALQKLKDYYECIEEVRDEDFKPTRVKPIAKKKRHWSLESFKIPKTKSIVGARK